MYNDKHETGLNNDSSIRDNSVTAIMQNNSNCSVSLTYDNISKLHSLTINGITFLSPKKECFLLPESILRGLDIADFPTSVTVYPYIYLQNNEIVLTSIPIGIQNNGNGTATVIIEACLESNERTGDIGIEAFQAIKYDLIMDQHYLQPNVHDCYFDGEIAHLHYSIILPNGDFQKVVEFASANDLHNDEEILMAAANTLQLTRSVLKLAADDFKRNE